MLFRISDCVWAAVVTYGAAVHIHQLVVGLPFVCQTCSLGCLHLILFYGSKVVVVLFHVVVLVFRICLILTFQMLNVDFGDQVAI